jgi:hypothetical protein
MHMLPLACLGAKQQALPAGPLTCWHLLLLQPLLVLLLAAAAPAAAFPCRCCCPYCRLSLPVLLPILPTLLRGSCAPAAP